MSHNGLQVASRGPREWTPEQRVKIDEIISRYPTKKSAIMPVLWLAQEAFDWLDLDVMRLVGRTLELPASHVHAVASFYTMFKKAPTGKYVIDVCQTLSCQLVGSDKIIAHLEKVLQVDAHGNSADGLFTLHKVECLASCGSAPMMQVNDHFYEFLTPDSVDEIVAAFRAGNPLSTPRKEADEWQWSPRS